MSLHCNPIIYLNMGGEMLYVLQQRLKAQKINTRKTTIVMDEITAALVHPKILSTIFNDSEISSLSWMRSTLENIALCSIMRLDADSMNKLFDLMMMMVKYQLSVATGPREVVLLTMNHVDAFRNMVTRSGTHGRITVVHEMIIKKYGPLTYDEVWQARNECLDLLCGINVRVSILLKLGLQNEDTTFNNHPRNYNEKFESKRDELGAIKLMDTPQAHRVGSFQLLGDRVTFLGKNIYTMNFTFVINKPQQLIPTKSRDKLFIKDKGTKAELGMLAMQLGTEDTSSSTRTFSLDLFDDIDVKTDDDIEKSVPEDPAVNQNNENNDKINTNDDYKNKLENICSDFLTTEDKIENKLNLLQLLDEAN
ncbi:protein OSCP1 [Microplitis demolitor]|uniref:protein OSCP1 n=1 Tax=Microplitis demolitor TaxID=69319 RepID=UPI0004CC97FD|nr:protein OSCP1 [Microplitis demolitor]